MTRHSMTRHCMRFLVRYVTAMRTSTLLVLNYDFWEGSIRANTHLSVGRTTHGINIGSQVAGLTSQVYNAIYPMLYILTRRPLGCATS